MPHFYGRLHARREHREVRTDGNNGREKAPIPVQLERREPTQEEIAALAYSYWEQRGRPVGSPCEDWFRAEQELRGQ